MRYWNKSVGKTHDLQNYYIDNIAVQDVFDKTIATKVIRFGLVHLLDTRRWGNTSSPKIMLWSFIDTGAGSNIAPDWGSFSFPPGWRGRAYFAEWDMPLSATPIIFTLYSGTLPTGLSLISTNGHSGSLSGTPTVAGTFTFSLKAQNIYGSSILAFSILISDGGLPPSGNGQIFPPAVFS